MPINIVANIRQKTIQFMGNRGENICLTVHKNKNPQIIDYLKTLLREKEGHVLDIHCTDWQSYRPIFSELQIPLERNFRAIPLSRRR